MDDLGAKDHYRLPSSFRKDQRCVGIITCLLGSGCNHHMTRVNILLCSGDNFLSQGPDLSVGCADGSYSIEQGAGSAPSSGSRTLEVELILSMMYSSSDDVHSSETPGISRWQEDASLGTISSSGFYGQRMAVLDSLRQISGAGSSSNLGQVSKAWEFRLVHLNASSSAKSCIAIQSPFHANSREYPVVRTMACVCANSSTFRHLTAVGSSDSRALPLEASMLLVVILITEWVMAQALTGYLLFLVLLSPPIQKDHSKQNLGIPHVLSSLGMVQDQEPKTLILLHAHIVLRMVMDMSWSYCCYQNLDIWAIVHIFKVHWFCSMGGYSRGSEHPNTLQAMKSIRAEGCWIFLSGQWLYIRILACQCCPHMWLIISKAGAEISNLMMRGKHKMEEDKGRKRSPAVAKKEKGENGERRERGESSSHDMHIWTERERRKKMRNMFSTLRSLLPDVPPKADKSGVVEEAVNHIKALEDTVQRLEKQKLEKLQGSNSLSSIAGTSKQAMLSTREKFIADQVSAINHNKNRLAMERTERRTSSSHLMPAIIQTWSSANVVLNVCGDDAQFVIYVPKKLGLFANICSVLDKHRLEAVFVHVSSEDNCSTYVIQARLANRAAHELPEIFTLEERYKQAAGEIMTLVSS